MSWGVFLLALMIVESGGNPEAVGKAGEVGILQIRPVVVDDCNRIFGVERWYLPDRYSIDKSCAMCRHYLEHYATEKRLGRPVTWEDRARIWNGGPNGHKKKSTEVYWAKVNKVLQALMELKP